MCTYSMVAKDWIDGPNKIDIPGYPTPNPPVDWPNFLPTYPLPSPSPVTPEIAKQMLDILAKVDDLDKKLGRIDCKLNEIEKKAYVEALRKVANQKCPCKKKKSTKKTKRAKITNRQLLNE